MFTRRPEFPAVCAGNGGGRGCEKKGGDERMKAVTVGQKLRKGDYTKERIKGPRLLRGIGDLHV